MSLEKEIFKGKTTSDLFKEIYKNSRDKEKRIDSIIEDLRDQVIDFRTAESLAPIIKDYLELAVKNDEHLIKMVAVVQKFENIKNGGTDEIISSDELQKILEDINVELPSVDNLTSDKKDQIVESTKDVTL
jgi:hypothetical protein